jgi:hypothetical protein
MTDKRALKEVLQQNQKDTDSEEDLGKDLLIRVLLQKVKLVTSKNKLLIKEIK